MSESANFLLQYCILNLDEEEVWLLWHPLDVKNNWTTAGSIVRTLLQNFDFWEVLHFSYFWHSVDATVIKLLHHRNWECNIVKRNLLILPCSVRNIRAKILSGKSGPFLEKIRFECIIITPKPRCMVIGSFGLQPIEMSCLCSILPQWKSWISSWTVISICKFTFCNTW